MTKETFTFRIDPYLKADLERLSFKDGRTLSGYIHKILQDHNSISKTNESVRREANNSDYEELRKLYEIKKGIQ